MTKTVPSMKKRERLAIEAYVRHKKIAGRPLSFTADDVIAHHGGKMKLPKRSVAKALQNMIYAKAGVLRGDGPGVCVVSSDTAPWLATPVSEHEIVGAATSNVRRRKKKKKRVAAQFRNPNKTPPGRVTTTAPEMVQHIMAFVEKSLSEKAEDFLATAARVIAALG